jgi:hypothetical protein
VKIISAVLLLQYACCEEAQKSDDKTVSKRGILHLNIHGHHLTPHAHHIHPHVHLASPHHHNHVQVPHFHLPTPHVHHHVGKIPVFHKPIVPLLPPPVIPTTPYHIHHGGATVTSYNLNYPRIPLVPKAIVPAVFPAFHHHAFVPHHHHHGILPHSNIIPHTHSILPHHHHHAAVYPHFHVNKPIIPVAVPGIRAPTYLPPKPTFVHSKPQFVPIPIPNLPSESTPIAFNPAGSENVPSCTTNHINHKGSWQEPMTRINYSPIKPNLNNFASPPYNYHAHKSTNDDNLYNKMTNGFHVSGQGTSGQYLAYPQQLIQEPQSNFHLSYS